MAELINPRRGEAVIDKNGYPTLRFIDYLQTNTDNTGANSDAVATNATNIATNVTDISTNVTNISTNVTNIATNTSNITTNTADIATNTSNIATNTADITTNSGTITTNTTNLANHESASDPHTVYYLADGTRDISGDLKHTGTNIGFYGVASTARPAAYTQTYSTTSRTHANLTSSVLTDSTGGTANTTLVTVSGTDLNNNFADLIAQINFLRADLENVKDVLNQVIEDDISQGLKQ